MFFFNFWSHFLLTYNMWIKKKNLICKKNNKKKIPIKNKVLFFNVMFCMQGIK